MITSSEAGSYLSLNSGLERNKEEEEVSTWGECSDREVDDRDAAGRALRAVVVVLGPDLFEGCCISATLHQATMHSLP